MIIRPFPARLILEQSVDRSPGLHASDIYNSLYEELRPKQYGGGPLDTNRVEAGLWFERMLEEGFKRRMAVDRPGELTAAEGYRYSPDALIHEEGGTILGEYKLTWMSCRECPISPEAEKETGVPSNWDGVLPVSFPPKFDKWMTQIKEYLYQLELLRAHLIAFFVNADYRPPRPVLLAWDLEFNQRVLDDNHRMLINHARHKGLL